MFEVTKIEFADLTESEQDQQPDNGCGKEEASYLRVINNGETVAIYSDAMEPEDCRFYKDMSWIGVAIQDAYELGKKDASCGCDRDRPQINDEKLTPLPVCGPKISECNDVVFLRDRLLHCLKLLDDISAARIQCKGNDTAYRVLVDSIAAARFNGQICSDGHDYFMTDWDQLKFNSLLSANVLPFVVTENGQASDPIDHVVVCTGISGHVDGMPEGVILSRLDADGREQHINYVYRGALEVESK